MMKASALFAFPESLPFADFFSPDLAPWQWVPRIAEALEAYDFSDPGQAANVPPGLHIEGKVYIHPTAKLPPYGVIQGPAWIGPECELRPGVYIRGKVICGKSCVLGNSSEFKNCLLLDGVQAPHFNYVGDSVLGNKAHLGAGVICANLRIDQKNVPVQTSTGERADSGLRKLGALVGDDAEAGCNSVLHPGSILGKRSVVLSMPFGGYLAPNTIAYPETKPKTMRRMI